MKSPPGLVSLSLQGLAGQGAMTVERVAGDLTEMAGNPGAPTVASWRQSELQGQRIQGFESQLCYGSHAPWDLGQTTDLCRISVSRLQREDN